MKLNYFLERISKTISGSKQDTKKVQMYSKRMTDDPEVLAQLVFVDDLRKKLAIKSLALHVGPIPRISLKRIHVKKEVNSFQELNLIGELEDVFGNYDQETYELEPAPGRLEPPPEPIKREEKAISPTKETKPGKLRKSRRLWYVKLKTIGMYQCKNCDKTYRSQQAVHAHYQSVHLKKRFKCDICNIASYVAHFDLKVHKKTCRETLEERLAKFEDRKRFFLGKERKLTFV